MRKNIYSVGQVNTYIKNMFAQDFMLHHISVKGEVSNCKYHSSGHIYFTLKDSTGTIQAVMFAGNRRGLRFQMKEGDNVVVTGSIEVYERDGKYQLYAREIALEGAGDLYQKYEALKRELEEMGMFAPEYKQSIPKYAKTVGIVTAPTGAAIQDIRNIAGRRNPYVQLILYPALVQGEGAVASIVQGIQAMESLQPDVLIVGRGGGPIEDLWAFNEEAVARAIFECSIPVISAVGHETDTTIADFVADLRAPTPSAAAELAVFDIQSFYEKLAHEKMQMNRRMEARLERAKQKEEYLAKQLQLLSPENQINSKRQYAMDLEERLGQLMQRTLRENQHRLELLAGALDGLSPAKKLSQGYSVVRNRQGKNIRKTEDVKTGETLQIHVTDGTIEAEVTAVKEN
ncbi:MAG: exodeoxyribonuclease VII large subunit [Lachnospiraceae bacterium]|nr:exodeoxyribonuclease VII large subunit [Lachnospiraceae bacterium]MDD7377684.1 exodeoxyribonuclease VII large subunit [Lachnospiraceae bacterium]MDY4616256.1 exodeoxyribonuclease VII large subunit [Lachnospiraceae bacterium]